jgi:hypothetical protein
LETARSGDRGWKFELKSPAPPCHRARAKNRRFHSRIFLQNHRWKLAMTDETPRYRALGKLCLEPGWRTIEDGAEFEYSGAPHVGMEALNASARKAKLASIGPRWRQNLRPQRINRLARSLGFSHGTDAEAAAHIENFIAHETQKETAS